MTATREFSYDVFLSHSSKDKVRVRRLAKRLRDRGLRVWFDEWIIPHGEDIYLAIERGLELSRVLVLCISPAAFESGWVTLERSTVLFRGPTNERRRFIPLLLADCELPDTLRRYKYVDFRKDSKKAFALLLAACEPETATAPQLAQRETPNQESTRPSASPKQLRQSIATFDRVLRGPADWVNCVSVCPDGTWAAAGSADKSVTIWDLASGSRRVTLEGHEGDVNAISITRDGIHILSGSSDNSIRVWHAGSGKCLSNWKASQRSVTSVVVMNERQQVISAGGKGDPVLRVWDVAQQRELAVLSGHTDAVTSVSVDKGAMRALSGAFDQTIRLWNLRSNECLAVLKGHSSYVKCVQFVPDSEFGVSCSKDGTIKIWDLKALNCVGTLEGHGDSVESVAISPIGDLVASAGFADNTIRIWNWKAGVCVQTIKVPEATTSVTFSPDGLHLLAGSFLGTVLNYQLMGVKAATPVEPQRRYTNAKVVLMGEGTVGKTSLAHRLIEDKYVICDRTHGMNVSRLELPLPPDATIEREALLWDLAGQEDYRLIHGLYLDETALALFLVNPQTDDPFAEAGDWLKALDAATVDHDAERKAARILVFSQTDVGGMKLSNAKIDAFREQYGFSEWLPTSAKTGENCSDGLSGGKPSRLKQLIAERIPWDKLPWTSTPRVLAELKKAVLAMKAKVDIRLLRCVELAQRLVQALPEERFEEADVRSAVKLLANHGLVLQLKFGDLVLLQPELLSAYAGAIIRAARAHTHEIGCVAEADIYREDFDFTGVDRLAHRPDEELLLRAIIQTLLDHSLCIAEDTAEGRHLVFPSQYRRDRNLPFQPDVFVSYTFRGEWQTVWTTLVVRLWYGREFEHKELWRNAAEFNSSKGHLLGLMIENQQGEGKATIQLFFDQQAPDELKVIFIEYIHRHLARYGTEVTRDRRYVCKCGKPVLDLTEVRERLTGGKPFIYCQKCDAQVPLIDHIEQRLKSDPVARKILAMEERATRELDTQALEQILFGHVQAITGEANQIFRPLNTFDFGIDGEVEFKDKDGKASGKKIYVQLKSGNSYLRTRRMDGLEIFDVKDDRHLDYWVSQPVDVYLVIRQTDERTNDQRIRWFNISRYLKLRSNKQSRQIVFEGEDLTMEAVWRVRDAYFPPKDEFRP